MAIELLEQPEERVEGQLKVSGQAQYAADFRMPGMLWAAFLNSTQPHARIVSIDTRAVREVPGVHAVLTGEEVGDNIERMLKSIAQIPAPCR